MHLQVLDVIEELVAHGSELPCCWVLFKINAVRGAIEASVL